MTTWKLMSKPRMHDRGEHQMDPLPVGPYIKVFQWDSFRYEKMKWNDAINKAKVFNDLIGEFPKGYDGQLPHGCIVFANILGYAVMVAYRYDSSD